MEKKGEAKKAKAGEDDAIVALIKEKLSAKSLEISAKAWFYLLPASNTKTVIEIIHIFFILFTAIQIPLFVAFRIEYTTLWILIEFVNNSELALYILSQLRTATYVQGILTVKLKHVAKNYWENGLFFDVVACVPLNLILMNAGYSWPVALLRVLRMAHTSNLKRIFGVI